MDFKEKIKKYRNDNNLTQDELANILHVSRQAISKYETGRSYPSVDVLQDIASLLGVSVDSLLSKDELTKKTIETSNKLKNNKFITLGLFTLIIVVLIVSLIAIIQVDNNKNKDNVNEDFEFCGIVGVANNENIQTSFDINNYINNQYFGFGKIFEKNQSYLSTMNMANAIIGQTNYEGDIYLSKRVKRIDFYSIYYDKKINNYIYEIVSSTSANDSLQSTVLSENYKGIIYTYNYNFIWFDEVIEMKIYEYDSSGNLLDVTPYIDQEKYIVNNQMLYIVIEEKMINEQGKEYYNRKIILNEEINNVYSYIIKETNENYLAMQTLLIMK